MNIDNVKRLMETQLVEDICDVVEGDVRSIDPSYIEGNFTDEPAELVFICITDMEIIDFQEEKSSSASVVNGEAVFITEAGAWDKNHKSCGSTIMPLTYTFQFTWDGEHATDLVMENVD